jgi:hypothetical protein
MQRICADTILNAWRAGTKNRIRLAHYAINTTKTFGEFMAVKKPAAKKPAKEF